MWMGIDPIYYPPSRVASEKTSCAIHLEAFPKWRILVGFPIKSYQKTIPFGVPPIIIRIVFHDICIN